MCKYKCFEELPVWNAAMKLTEQVFALTESKAFSYKGDLKSEISNLKTQAESISRRIRTWAGSLQNTDIKGLRHLTGKSRAVEDQKKRAEAFLEKLKSVQKKSSLASD
jgi:hypothetical protein